MEYLDKFHITYSNYGEHGRIYMPKRDGRIITSEDVEALYVDSSLEPQRAIKALGDLREEIDKVLKFGGLIQSDRVLPLRMVEHRISDKDELDQKVTILLKGLGRVCKPGTLYGMQYYNRPYYHPHFLYEGEKNWIEVDEVRDSFNRMFRNRFKRWGLKHVVTPATVVDALMIELVKTEGNGEMDEAELQTYLKRFDFKYSLGNRRRVVDSSLVLEEEDADEWRFDFPDDDDFENFVDGLEGQED